MLELIKMELGKEQLNQLPGMTKSLQLCAKRLFLTPWGDNSFSPATCQAGETGVGIKKTITWKMASFSA